MFYTCILLLLSALPQIYSVPCQQIGKGNYDGPTGMVPQLDPFTAGQGFDIIQSQDCLLRFQNPDYNMIGSQSDLYQAIMASRVTKATWATTQDSYEETCNNYNGGFGSNAMLWLGGAAEPYQYAGVLLRSATNAQSGLQDAATVVNYLLPSGVGKITKVGPGADASDNCQRLQNAGGIGIAGTVDPNVDYAYAPLFRVAVGLAARYPDPRNVQLFQAPSPDYPWGSSSGAFVTADRADGSCVVIDFRSMPAYMMNIEGYPNAVTAAC